MIPVKSQLVSPVSLVSVSDVIPVSVSPVSHEPLNSEPVNLETVNGRTSSIEDVRPAASRQASFELEIEQLLEGIQ